MVLANVDTPVDREPAANVYVDHRARWWEITDDLPRYGGESGTEKQ